MSFKNCPKCDKKSVVKNGLKNGKQSYKCQNCKYRFTNKSRKSRVVKGLRKEYSLGKQTYKQIGENIGKSERTVQRLFDEHIIYKDLYYNDNIEPRSTHIIADVSKFGEGLLVFMIKSYEYNKVVYAKCIESENIEVYVEGIEFMKLNGWEIRGITADGFKGIRQRFSDIPYQMCIFHQVAIITRYVGKYPKLQANKELRRLVLQLKNNIGPIMFEMYLEEWHNKWEAFLKEKSYSKDGKKYWFTHKKTRSAYKSLKTNLPVLFTYKKRNMPRTTNALDGYFAVLKAKLGIHTGLSNKRKLKLLFSLLE